MGGTRWHRRRRSGGHMDGTSRPRLRRSSGHRGGTGGQGVDGQRHPGGELRRQCCAKGVIRQGEIAPKPLYGSADGRKCRMPAVME